MPEQVDGALKMYGMAMGPFEMGDLAGNDIGWLVRKSRGLTDPATRPANIRYCEIGDKMCAAGRLGHKTGKGWYKYDKSVKGAIVDGEVAELIKEHRNAVGAPQHTVTDAEVIERCLYPLVNEAFLTLEESIAARPSDIDVVYTNGYGFPDWRGGPMFWAETEVGLPRLLATIRRYQAQFPNVPHWRPSQLLVNLAEANEPLSAWEAHLPGRAGLPGRAKL
mmetsp:Transcript_1210/g.2899  ORF Transcript_1210/g.2899 Transcript_1210/m.2899 type:complete len:221 (-) Transcript_1210:53-715(-)